MDIISGVIVDNSWDEPEISREDLCGIIGYDYYASVDACVIDVRRRGYPKYYALKNYILPIVNEDLIDEIIEEITAVIKDRIESEKDKLIEDYGCLILGSGEGYIGFYADDFTLKIEEMRFFTPMRYIEAKIINYYSFTENYAVEIKKFCKNHNSYTVRDYDKYINMRNEVKEKIKKFESVEFWKDEIESILEQFS